MAGFRALGQSRRAYNEPVGYKSSYGIGAGPLDNISFSNVRLLLHGDGADGATAITDSSSYARTMTRVGTAEVDTAQSVFGGSSLYIPASTSGWTTPSDANLDPRAGAFQIDWRHRLAANLTDAAALDTVLAMVNGDNWLYEWGVVVTRNYIYFYWGQRGVSSGGLRLLYPAGVDLATLGATQLAFSVARDTSGNWGGWINGQRCPQYQYATQASSPSWPSAVTGTYNNAVDLGASGSRLLNVGRFHSFAGLAQTKHIDELRFAIGESRNVFTDYTPMPIAFPNA